MAHDLPEFRALLVKGLSNDLRLVDDQSLAELYRTRVSVDFPSKIDLPGMVKDLEVYRIPFDRQGRGISLPVAEVIKATIFPAGKGIVEGVWKFEPKDVVFSVLEILGEVGKRLNILDRQQMAICRAVLLVMDKKKSRVLLEKGASLTEIRDALVAQRDDVPHDLEASVNKLVDLKALEIEVTESIDIYERDDRPGHISDLEASVKELMEGSRKDTFYKVVH
jgi:hypothetical protein